MVFSSLVFIFRFLPIAILLYFMTPKKYKNITLMCCSLFFYAWGEPKYILIMILSIIVDYSLSLFIEHNRGEKVKSRGALILSIIFNLGMLFVFKYINFFIGEFNDIFQTTLNTVSLTLPLGISFYTFQTMSYTIDVYLGKVRAEKNIINFGTFVTLFPQLIAGPIVKYTDINKELKNRKSSTENIDEGIRIFILGLSKKVLIANNIGFLWEEISKVEYNSITTPLAWLGILAFGLQIYFDFSGYSSMAIGLGKILGFTFPENFNYPYISRSITEFWRRWHMTLSSWFKEYVYIPLGGNRKGKFRTILNLLIVWSLTGFWHGASYNFILWGLYFFLLLMVEKFLLGKFLSNHKVLAHIYTIVLLLVGYVFFAITDMSQIRMYLSSMFSFNFESLSYLYYLRNYGVILIIGIVFSTPLINNAYNKYVKNKWVDTIIMMILFIVSVAYLVDSTYNPFLYFRF